MRPRNGLAVLVLAVVSLAPLPVAGQNPVLPGGHPASTRTPAPGPVAAAATAGWLGGAIAGGMVGYGIAGGDDIGSLVFGVIGGERRYPGRGAPGQRRTRLPGHLAVREPPHGRGGAGVEGGHDPPPGPDRRGHDDRAPDLTMRRSAAGRAAGVLPGLAGAAPRVAQIGVAVLVERTTGP